MKKRDLTKLALAGLTAGLLVSTQSCTTNSESTRTTRTSTTTTAPDGTVHQCENGQCRSYQDCSAAPSATTTTTQTTTQNRSGTSTSLPQTNDMQSKRSVLND
ncbi:MAG: hypothetical protein JHC93_01355 [Parachlamydiales bacterium]|nr:hypothetical protein [Parachlamydiales bacterium]